MKASEKLEQVMAKAPEALRGAMGMVGSMVHDMVDAAGPEDLHLVDFQRDLCLALADVCQEKAAELRGDGNAA